ncbi:MAG: PadR family transcriptional regulator [Halobacteriales archaeon]|nr:PadR family transcriptional regulator [Halobacteriales archaeon]
MSQRPRGNKPVGSSEGTTISVEQLQKELTSATETQTSGPVVRLAPEQQSEVVLDEVTTTLFGDDEFSFDDEIIKSNLEEILLLLVAHRSSDSHGKGLMGDLASVFDTRLSPGTVYPRLHDLEDDGALEVHELVRTKEYRVDDEEKLRERVESAMEQHLALGYFMQSALSSLD